MRFQQTQQFPTLRQGPFRPLARIIISVLALNFMPWYVGTCFSLDAAAYDQMYWIDESGAASLRAARLSDFKRYEGAVSVGYSSAALWIRLRIDGRSDTQKVAILVRPTFISRVELYDPSMKGTDSPPIVSGRDAPFLEDNHVGLDNGFVIPASPQRRDVYLRITTSTTLTAEVDVMSVESATRKSYVLSGFVAIYFAFLFGFLVWSLVNWGVRRDALYGIFALRQFYALAHLFVFFGSLRFFLSGSLDSATREILYVFITCTVSPVVGFFDFRLLSDLGASRRMRPTMAFLLALPVVSLVIFAMGDAQHALQFSAWIAGVQRIALAAYAFTIKSDPSQPLSNVLRGIVRTGFVLMLVIVMLPILMYQNLLKANVSIFTILFLHPAISTVILVALLSIRSQRRDFLAHQAEILVSMKETERQKEAMRRLEKERFLSMLTHELRNPLSVIELLPGSDKSSVGLIQKAAREMAQIIDRVEQSEMIESGSLLNRYERVDVPAILEQQRSEHLARDRLVVESAPIEPLMTDGALVHRIIANLLDNAAKYSTPGTVIRVTIKDSTIDGKSGVLLCFTNRIARGVQPDPQRLFSKYYRAKGAHGHPGSGLGLFLVASWIEALGGTVGYTQESEIDGDALAVFTVWVPR